MKTDLWPTTGVQFTSDEHAAILAGLVVKSAAGVPRAGVLPRNTNTLVTARPDMRVNILPMELVHVKEGARFAALTETIDVAIPNPPSANTQYNIICYVGTDEKLTGVASTSDFVVIPGTPSATPSDPALPDAAIPIARVAVPSAATATNSAGVSITALHPFTASAGGVVMFRTLSEMYAWVPGRSQQGRIVGSRGIWEFDGSDWVPLFAMAGHYATGMAISNAAVNAYNQTPSKVSGESSAYIDEVLALRSGGFTAPTGGVFSIGGALTMTSSGVLQKLNVRIFIDVTVTGNSSRRLTLTTAAAEDTASFAPVTVRVPAGGTISFGLYQASGIPVVFVFLPDVTYLGPLT